MSRYLSEWPSSVSQEREILSHPPPSLSGELFKLSEQENSSSHRERRWLTLAASLQTTYTRWELLTCVFPLWLFSHILFFLLLIKETRERILYVSKHTHTHKHFAKREQKRESTYTYKRSFGVRDSVKTEFASSAGQWYVRLGNCFFRMYKEKKKSACVCASLKRERKINIYFLPCGTQFNREIINASGACQRQVRHTRSSGSSSSNTLYVAPKG